MALYDHEFWDQVRKLPNKQAQAVSLFYLEDRPVAGSQRSSDAPNQHPKSIYIAGGQL
jgi:hypothetical protein